MKRSRVVGALFIALMATLVPELGNAHAGERTCSGMTNEGTPIVCVKALIENDVIDCVVVTTNLFGGGTVKQPGCRLTATIGVRGSSPAGYGGYAAFTSVLQNGAAVYFPLFNKVIIAAEARTRIGYNEWNGIGPAEETVPIRSGRTLGAINGCLSYGADIMVQAVAESKSGEGVGERVLNRHHHALFRRFCVPKEEI